MREKGDVGCYKTCKIQSIKVKKTAETKRKYKDKKEEEGKR